MASNRTVGDIEDAIVALLNVSALTGLYSRVTVEATAFDDPEDVIDDANLQGVGVFVHATPMFEPVTAGPVAIFRQNVDIEIFVCVPARTDNTPGDTVRDTLRTIAYKAIDLITNQQTHSTEYATAPIIIDNMQTRLLPSGMAVATVNAHTSVQYDEDA